MVLQVLNGTIQNFLVNYHLSVIELSSKTSLFWMVRRFIGWGEYFLVNWYTQFINILVHQCNSRSAPPPPPTHTLTITQIIGECSWHYVRYMISLVLQNATRVSKDFIGCSTLKKYYCQLAFLQTRFPFHEGLSEEVELMFTWWVLQETGP